ncbi:MAG: peptidase C11 [Oscillospiraceae bacterium]|nr:peptidase C11 [Oscillospiraceae bacterium]
MEPNRPRSRDKNVTSGGSGVGRRGSGLGSGPVGQGGHGQPSGGGFGKRAAIAGGGGGGLILLVVVAIMIFGGKGGSSGMLGTLLGGGDTGSYYSSYTGSTSQGQTPAGFNNYDMPDYGSTANDAVTGSVDQTVASGSRGKYTTIAGNGQDTVTIMVYMCGTDLESKYGMASSDLSEMASANLGSNVNILAYTGGCSKWKTSGISNSTNQIYQVTNGGLKCLVKDDGEKVMTEPATLTGFINYCATNFPANRYELIMWDHGGGSVSGYGYDEKFKSKGSMSLAGVRNALQNSGVKFDFIGFDACLMATAETALMLNDYADYMIASEETEPGIGWYYTNWLNKLGQNPSMPTLEIGKNIVDDFVSECGKRCQGQKTTLSVVDLAEFSNTVPGDLTAFSKSLTQRIQNQDYKSVSDARYATREFAQSSKIDQVDLVDLAQNMGNDEGRQLAESIKNAVKYNRTSPNMTHAYGISIFFPYKRTSYVDKACKTYDQIGMDAEYASCIRQFASLETSGQIAAGGSSAASPMNSLFNIAGSLGGSSGSSEMIGQLLNGFLSSGRGIDGLDTSNTDFMTDRAMSDEQTADYLSLNYFDPSYLVWEQTADGKYTMSLPEAQWSLVHTLDMSMFYDDGTGYVDLGMDNLYSFDDAGNLVADTDRNWLSINGQVVAYYHTDTTEAENDQYTISGYVPALLNGERVNLIIVFDAQNPAGYIAGATTDYIDGETDTVAKSMTELQVGDTLDFICDYYSYEQEYLDSYYLGNQMTVTDNMQISNTDVGDGAVKIMYRFTDIYNQTYWTEAITQ